MSSSSRLPTTILALIPNWLGDLVLSLPALAALGRRGVVVAVGAPALVDLLADLGAVDRVVAYDRHGGDLRGLWATARRLRNEQPQMAVAFPPGLRAAVLARLSGAPRRRGVARVGGGWFLNETRSVPAPGEGEHLAETWLKLVDAAEPLPSSRVVAALQPGPRGRDGLARLAQQHPGLTVAPYLVLAPGALYGPAKRWSPSRFGELGRRLATARGWRVVVVGSARREEKELCRAVAATCDGLDLAGATDLPTLAALLARAHLFVGNDSGPMHLAAAAGTPTLGIFGSTSPRWTGPRGPAAAVLGPHPVPCSPCFRRRCPIGLPCLDELSVTAALEVAEGLLAGVPA